MKRAMARHWTRRDFLKCATAALAAPHIIPAGALGLDGRPAPSERVTLGFLGLGGHGIGRNLNGFLKEPESQPVALCDVMTSHIENAVRVVRKKFGESYTCMTTRDWREVIARPDVDAVVISTPDHWHVFMSVAAIRAGKDVLCEKPTFNIAEGRLLADTVKRYGAVFQTATEDRSLTVYHRMAELVRNQRIGKLRRILVKLPQKPDAPGDPTPVPV
ncbi:MAG: Gfo/Idh/MocA family oxidoreductase, partial [Verrucomicrobiae bacterium]|nr:Gfo/Idh/MocA family oxidoreductase [Verrucomicrobiae bacterium]